MIEFVESPLFSTWFEKHKPEKSLVICTPYIKQNALDKLINLYGLDPLASEFDFKLVIRGATEEFTYNRSSDISVLDTFVGIDGYDVNQIRKIENLHMKAYLVDDKDLLITSGNLTNSGLFVNGGRGNFEGGIATDDAAAIERFKAYFQLIWDQSTLLPDFYDEIHDKYNEYIKNDYSDKKTLKRIRKKKYQFSKKQDGLISLEEVSFDDLPPVGDFGYVDATIEFLNSGPLGYMELGQKLRAHLDLIPENEEVEKAKVNNNKFGEEKGKFLVYLGLATLDRSKRPYKFSLNKLGKSYFKMESEDKKKLIKDQILSKVSIQQILAYYMEDADGLKKSINNLSLASDDTMKRKMGTLNKLLAYIRDLSPEEELLEIVDQINQR